MSYPIGRADSVSPLCLQNSPNYESSNTEPSRWQKVKAYTLIFFAKLFITMGNKIMGWDAEKMKFSRPTSGLRFNIGHWLAKKGEGLVDRYFG